MKVIARPARRHVCDGLASRCQPTSNWWYSSIASSFGGANLPDGSVAACTCGKTWVAGHAPGLVPNVWRQEGRWERWRRERKSRRAAA